MKVSIIGSGVLGEATGVGLSMKGNETIFHDIDSEKLGPFRRSGYKVTENISEAISHSVGFLRMCSNTHIKWSNGF